MAPLDKAVNMDETKRLKPQNRKLIAKIGKPCFVI